MIKAQIKTIGKLKIKRTISSLYSRHLYLGSLIVVFAFIIACKERELVEKSELLALGTIEFNAIPESCGDSKCFSFTTSSDQLASAQSGIIKIDEPNKVTKGTIVMYSGGKGTFYYDRWKPSKTIIDEALELGYRVIQLKWDNGWFPGAENQLEGFRKLAVHPATITKYIYDRLDIKDQPLILFGSSGGAAQIAYMLSFYGIDAITDKAIIFSGFWMGRLDIGCFDDSPINSHLSYSERARIAIDGSFGFLNDVKGPCELRDTSFIETYRNSSISYGGNYYYPNTDVYLLYGGNDQVGALNQGLTYYEQLIKAKSPLVYMQVVEGSGHSMLGDSLGFKVIQKTLFTDIKQLSTPED